MFEIFFMSNFSNKNDDVGAVVVVKIVSFMFQGGSTTLLKQYTRCLN